MVTVVAEPNLPARRELGSVVRGFIFGLVLGLVAVLYTRLALPRSKRREDVLLGAWLGTVIGAALIAGALVLNSVMSRAGDEPNAPVALPVPRHSAEDAHRVIEQIAPRGCSIAWPTLDATASKAGNRFWKVSCQTRRTYARSGATYFTEPPRGDIGVGYSHFPNGWVSDSDLEYRYTYNCYSINDTTLEVQVWAKDFNDPCP